MAADGIGIYPSRKVGLGDWQYILTVGDYVCLRIVASDAGYNVMTATADEDDKSFVAPLNQALLIDLANKTAEALGVTPVMLKDLSGRSFMGICQINDPADEVLIHETFRRIVRENVEAVPVESVTRADLREIYQATAP